MSLIQMLPSQGSVNHTAARRLKKFMGPSPKLELALFLDPSRFGSAVSEIKAAWNRGKAASMPHTDYLDEFLEDRRGGLLLVVGHVEGKDFVMQDAFNRSMTLSIPLLLRKSLDHDVIVIPIGCKTAGADTPIGFLENIGTDAVERFLRQLPQNQPVFADLFAGLRTIGDMQVKLRDTLGQLDIEVKTGDAPEAEATRLRIGYPRPASPAASNSAPSPSFTDAILADADQLRPWWDQNWARAIRKNPFTYLAASTLLFVVAVSWRHHILTQPYAVPNRYLVAGLKVLAHLIHGIAGVRLAGMS